MILTEILDRFSPQHRLILGLRIDRFTVEEIAEISGRSRRSIERILQETRAKLRGLLEEDL